jgi:hypothetical protein
MALREKEPSDQRRLFLAKGGRAMPKAPIQPPPTAHAPANPDPAAALSREPGKAPVDGAPELEPTPRPRPVGLEDLAAPTGSAKPLYKPASTYSPIGAIPEEDPNADQRRTGPGARDVRAAETSTAERGKPGLTLSDAETAVAGGRRK